MIGFVAIAIVIGFALYATLLSNNYKKEILVNSSVSRVQKEISSIYSIAKWYLPFNTSDTSLIKKTGNNILSINSDSLIITSLTGLSARYKIIENKNSGSIALDVTADTAGHSKVTLSYRSSLWAKITGSDPIITNAEKSLLHLKEYFEDTKKMYGYQMEVIELTDTTFLFTSKVVANHTKKDALKSTYESLIKYAQEKDMNFTGTRIFYTSPFGNDSTHLFLGVGISNTSNALLTGDYTLKKMPYKGHLLSAFYQGSFGNVNKVLEAMERFKADNEMTTMAIPFVKLLTENADFDDSQVIQARAYYPVF